MRIDVPYYSQWLDVADPDWQRRSCGIVALKMAMLALHSPRRSRDEEGDMGLDELIKRGIELGAYKPNIGWVHEGLVFLAKKYGFTDSFRKEWAADKSADGINFIVDNISQNIPVIASVKSEAGGHLILLTGFEKTDGNLKNFYYNDPGAKSISEGKNKIISKDDFLKFWKGRIIVVAR